jgi:uncharacterized protein
MGRGLDLLVVQPTALCNLDCTYCYVPDRLDPRRLAFAHLEQLLLAVRASRLASTQRELKILWHAGEPLAAGLDYFKEAFRLTERLVGDRWRIRHAIQTNGVLITRAWCRLFLTHTVSLGISVDGPAHVHDITRKTRAGRGSFAQVMRGVDLLSEHGIPLHALCVLGAHNIDHPADLFDFFLDRGFRQVAFNIEEIEGPHRRSSLVDATGRFGPARARYRAFMETFLELNRQRGRPLAIREFAKVAGLLLKRREDPASVPAVAEQRVGAILTMARDGTVYSWSPELASGVPGDSHRFALGHIGDVESVDELLDTPRARAIQEEVDRGVSRCRQECGYFGVCGGGSPGNKFYEGGTFATTETLKCALQVQELTELVLAPRQVIHSS